MKNQRNCFRTFYRNLVDILLNDSHIIYSKVKKLNKNTSNKNTSKKYNNSKHVKKYIQTKKIH